MDAKLRKLNTKQLIKLNQKCRRVINGGVRDERLLRSVVNVNTLGAPDPVCLKCMVGTVCETRETLGYGLAYKCIGSYCDCGFILNVSF